MTRRRAVRRLVLPVVALVGLAACGSGPDAGPVGLGADLTVVAAASLTDVLQEIGDRFEAEHGVTVTFSFGSSAALAEQLRAGAVADVYAAASPEPMARVVGAGLVDGEPVVFARNRLQIAVPAGNPAGVTGLDDLARDDLLVALCAEQVPCGAAARTVLDAAGVRLTPVTLERDVKAALSKVTLGEVDAALVYRTDAAASPEVEGIEFAASARAVNDYPVAVLRDAPNPTAARAFLEFLFSEAGTAVLVEAGFQLP